MLLQHSSGSGLSPQEQKDWTVESQLPDPNLPRHNLSGESREAIIYIRWSSSPAKISGFRRT